MSRTAEGHWWEKEVPVNYRPADWCPVHNYYYDGPKGQTCARCDSARKSGAKRREPRDPMGDSALDEYLAEADHERRAGVARPTS